MNGWKNTTFCEETAMKMCIVFACAAVLGVALGLALCRVSGKRLRRRNRELRAIAKGECEPVKPETTKRVIWVCLFNGFAWVWCSYILAYTNHTQIAESLSQVAVTEIIGVVLAYCIKSAVENLSKNNHWPDKAVQPEPETPEPEQDEPPDAGS